MMRTLPPVIHGFNSSRILATVREDEDPPPYDKEDSHEAEEEPFDLQPDEPLRQSFSAAVRANSRLIAIEDDVGEELPDMPSEMLDLIGARGHYEHDPPVDDCTIPVDEDLVDAIIDARG